MKTNLFSISKATKGERKITFNETGAEIRNKKNEIILNGKRRGELYFIEPEDFPVNEINNDMNRLNKWYNSVSALSAESTLETKNLTIKTSNDNVSEIKKWHLRFGHLNENSLKKLSSDCMVNGLSLKSSEKLSICETCIVGKHSQTPFPKISESRSKKLLNLIHSDVCGPFRTKSLGGSQYFATFIDDKSKYTEVYFLKKKSDVKNAFIKYKALVEKQTEQKVKISRTDNGLEYVGKDFDDYLEQCGIKRERTVAYTPQQNGTAERMNRTLTEMARCLLLQAKLPKFF